MFALWETLIRLDDSIPPVQHAPQRVQVALREPLQVMLSNLTEQGVIAPVQEPTPRISSIDIVHKKDSSLQICLDPKDQIMPSSVNTIPLLTIKDIATRLHGARFFMILDVRQGFWHEELNELSSFLTTFHTPFVSLKANAIWYQFNSGGVSGQNA